MLSGLNGVRPRGAEVQGERAATAGRNRVYMYLPTQAHARAVSAAAAAVWCCNPTTIPDRHSYLVGRDDLLRVWVEPVISLLHYGVDEDISRHCLSQRGGSFRLEDSGGLQRQFPQDTR